MRYSLVTILQIGLSLSSVAQSDDFEDGDAAGWFELDPLGGLGAGPIAKFEVVDRAFRITASASPNPAAAGPGRGGAFRQDVTYEDTFFLSVDVPAFDASLEQAFGLFAFIQPGPSLGTTNSYAFTYQPITNDIQITRIIGEAQENTFESNVDLSDTPNDAIRLVFFGSGGEMEGRIYNLDDLATPLAVTTATDTMFTSGTTGLVVLNNQQDASGTADATFDNYVANDGQTPAPEIVAGEDEDEYWVRYPDWVIGYELQTRETLEDGDWLPVPPGSVLLRDGFFQFPSEFVAAPTTFYRLSPVGE